MCVLISGSLQYVDGRNRIVLEYVPESIYKAVYHPSWLLNGKQVLGEIGKCYTPILPLPNFIDCLPLVEGQTARIVPHYGSLFAVK